MVARYNTWLPENLIEALRQRSDETGVPQAKILTKALEAYFDMKGDVKPKGPSRPVPDTSPRPGKPRLRGQKTPPGVPFETAESPKKAPRNTALSREIVDEEQIERFSPDKESTCSQGFNIHACNAERPCIACQKRDHYAQ